MMLGADFFDRDAREVAAGLLGKALRHRVGGVWLSAMVVEAEAYFLDERGSHASLGYTHKRRALFMPAGTIYMYYARGGDSLNFSCRGAGNAVLVKAAAPLPDAKAPADLLERMARATPLPSGRVRPAHRLCAGQTLLCRALGLKVPDWDARTCDPGTFYVEDVGERPARVVQARRLGIPEGRDEHLPHRYIHGGRLESCTKNPLTERGALEGRDYWFL